MEITSTAFDWIKALHVISVISWMVGLLYLPRLFIYHCESEKGSDKSETFKIMERRLLRAIMNPAMVISFITGGLMVYSYGYLLVTETWFLAKVICLFLLVIIHMYMSKWRKEFEGDVNQKSQKFFRYMNEVPTVLMIIIVIMVIVKPF
mgnify:FL=1